VAERVAAGERVAGWKIGATSAPVRVWLGTDEPFYGVLFAGTRLPPGGVIDVSCLARPLLECEVAFELRAEVRGSGVGAREVQAATSRLYAAFELVGEVRPPASPSAGPGAGGESRADAGPPSLAGVIAGNGSSAAFVLAASGPSPSEVDLRSLQVALSRGEEVVACGQAESVMGDPCLAVAWLADKLTEAGGMLRAGDIVLSGSMTPPVAVRPGDTFTADFGALGMLSVTAATGLRRAIMRSSTLDGGESA